MVMWVCLLVGASVALDNGLGLTPQMAWNSWNAIGCHINETLIKQMANAVISTGLNKIGYTYVNMDDCWAASRNASGFIEPDPTAFPSGIKALADYVHSLGLKFGLYSDAGNKTCAGRPGSLGYEKQDAEQYAAWGVDYLKYDNCNNDGIPDLQRYTAMKNALNATGRPIFFSLCDWAVTTAPWGVYTGNSWRTTTDINPYWDSWTNNLDQSNMDAPFAAPGGWNDPDMLEVGNGLPPNENVAHFSLWALVKAPLVLGNDLRIITQDVLEILSNTEVIEISQDPLGEQGARISFSANPADSTLFGNNLYASACDGSTAQQFSYDASTGTIISKLTGLCVGSFTPYWACGFTGASMGGNLYLQACNQSCGYRLQTFNMAQSQWTTNFGMGETLCVTSLSRPSGQDDVVMWNCSANAASQQWTYSNGAIQNGQQCLTISGGGEVWAAKLTGGAFAVGLFNRAAVEQSITVNWSSLGITTAAAVRDLWNHTDVGTFASSYTASVASHAIAFLKVTPQ